MAGRTPDQRIRTPVNLQTWHDLTFLHWSAEPGRIQAHLPSGLEVDTHDGRAWIGVTPFLMRDVRVPGVPAVPHLSSFPEVNLRTYVRRPDGSTGIWFFSLDCPRLPVIGALRALGLPYHWADLRVERVGHGVVYRASRRTGRARMRATVEVGDPLPEPDPLTDFLTGRWAAYTSRFGRLWRVPIEHEPWPLRTASARTDVAPLATAAGLPALEGQVLAHFSPGVHVRIGPPRPG